MKKDTIHVFKDIMAYGDFQILFLINDFSLQYPWRTNYEVTLYSLITIKKKRLVNEVEKI